MRCLSSRQKPRFLDIIPAHEEDLTVEEKEQYDGFLARMLRTPHIQSPNLPKPYVNRMRDSKLGFRSCSGWQAHHNPEQSVFLLYLHETSLQGWGKWLGRGGLEIQRIIWTHRCNYLLQILYQHMYSYLCNLSRELLSICLNKHKHWAILRLYHLKIHKWAHNSQGFSQNYFRWLYLGPKSMFGLSRIVLLETVVEFRQKPIELIYFQIIQAFSPKVKFHSVLFFPCLNSWACDEWKYNDEWKFSSLQHRSDYISQFQNQMSICCCW